MNHTPSHPTVRALGLVLAALLSVTVTVGPARAKTGRTYYPDDVVAAARAKVQRYDWAKKDLEKVKKRCAWILKMSDEELWDYVPPADQLRATNVAFGVGCPVHGKMPSYDWHTDRQHPFQVQCSKGKEWYPSNTFIPWHDGGREGELDTHEKYVDDGTGYVGKNGQHYYFVAYYVFWGRWRHEIMGGLRNLSKAYMLTGDQRYAHKAAVLMASVARVYPNTQYSKQAVHSHYGAPPNPVKGGILDRVWENSGVATRCATTYDAIFPIFGHDPGLDAFLKTRGVDDPRTYIEQRLLFELVDRISGGPEGKHTIQIKGNFGMYQRSLAQLAVALDNDDPDRGMTTDQMVDWIMSNDGGHIRNALYNRFYHDGLCSDAASPKYGYYGSSGVYTVASLLQRVGVNLFERPKMKQLGEAYLNLAVLGEFSPSIGDTGSVYGSRRIGWVPSLLLPLFEATGSPRVARALEEGGFGDKHNLWSNPPVKQVEQAAAEYPQQWPRHSRALGGYGDAILESHDKPVGLSLYYGYAGSSHGHYDRLNIEMFAFDKPMLPDLGYPHPLGSRGGYNKRMAWTSGTISHYGVLVNRHRQSTAEGYTTWNAGDLNLVLAGPGVQVADAGAIAGAYPHKVNIRHKMVDASRADDGYPDNVSLYRRTCLLIDQPGGQPYLFDLFRVQGGWEHAWSFHGPPDTDFQPDDLDLGPVQEKGTLAGPDVKFGESSHGPTDSSSGFQYLKHVQRATPPGDKAWGAQWLDKEHDQNLRLTMVPGSAQRVAVTLSEPQQRENAPAPMPYIVAFNGSPENRGEHADVGSDFAAVVEPFKNKANITRVRRLTSHGTPHALAAEVDRRGGRDRILSTLDSGGRLIVRTDDGRLMLNGELGLVRHHDDGPDAVLAINAHRIQTPGVEVLQPRLLEGLVDSVDYDANTIRLKRAWPAPRKLVGRTITFRGQGDGEAYQIAAARNQGGATVLTLKTPLIVGSGKMKSIDAAGNLATDTRFGSHNVDGGDHTGRTLLGPDKQRGLKITAPFSDDHFQLKSSGAAVRRLFAHAGGDADAKQFWIGAVGPGDRWAIPTCVHVRVLGQAVYRIDLNTPATLTLHPRNPSPDAAWSYRNARGGWTPLTVEHPGPGEVRFDLDPADLPDEGTIVKRD